MEEGAARRNAGDHYEECNQEQVFEPHQISPNQWVTLSCSRTAPPVTGSG